MNNLYLNKKRKDVIKVTLNIYQKTTFGLEPYKYMYETKSSLKEITAVNFLTEQELEQDHIKLNDLGKLLYE